APLGGSPDGHHGLAAYVQSVLDRLLQEAARVQLVGGRDTAGADVAAFVYRLSAARRSTRFLGRDGGNEYGPPDAFSRPRRAVRGATRNDSLQRRPVRSARRLDSRRKRALALLHLALHRHSDNRFGLYGRSLLARAQGRRNLGACARGA